MDDQRYYVILYDVSCDKRRRRLFKLLEGFGASYQYSVFEARLDDRQLVLLRHGIKQLLDATKDRAAILSLCQNCRESAGLLGRQQTTICQHVLIV